MADWVSKNDEVARSLPIYVGGLSLLAVLFNRTVSGIAPVADASRSFQEILTHSDEEEFPFFSFVFLTFTIPTSVLLVCSIKISTLVGFFKGGGR